MQATLSLQDSQEGGFSATTHHHPLSPPPTTTRTTSSKRPFSPSSASPSPKKSLKKSSPTTTTTNQGFSKITLPITFPSLSSSPLHRTLSEPMPSINHTNTPFSPFSATSHHSSSTAHFLNPQSQETAKNTTSPSPPGSSSSLHKLLRSISDPTTLSFGLQSGETASSKRLEKMKGIVKGISQLCDEVIYEDENETEDANNEDLVNKDCSDVEDHEHNGEDQEAVSVEKKGDCLVLHFNCPCGLGYEILLSGKDCYYRLT